LAKKELEREIKKLGVTDISICDCGAITIQIGSGEYSFHRKRLKEYFPGLVGITGYPSLITNKYGDCNWCVNNWGLDLCKCGSGKLFQRCCKVPYQTLKKNRT
jgi:hypothetical protein